MKQSISGLLRAEKFCTLERCPCTSVAVIEVHEQGFVEEVVEHVEHAVEGEVNDEEP